jgi:hypothetical protein
MQAHSLHLLLLLMPVLRLPRFSTLLQCKHQLAALLAFALKRCPVTVVPDSAIAQFLLDS